ncbi:transposase [Branchiibius hedensis]|uniref:transposase n=1 Tax=Branchiibius hedensis TaxID=672460 RepID=UPI001FE25315|nr:transposase [Branchiibius hedensis]
MTHSSTRYCRRRWCAAPVPRRTGAGNSRGRFRHGDLDTRVGTLDVAVRSCGEGLLIWGGCSNACERAERALTSVVGTWYLLGVTTRRMDKLVRTLGITGLSSDLGNCRVPRSKYGCPHLEGQLDRTRSVGARGG